jgi:Mg2+ and Co2+ transporter CorA
MEVRAVEWKALDGSGWAQAAQEQAAAEANAIYGVAEFELGAGFRLRDHVPAGTSLLAQDGGSLSVVVGGVDGADLRDLRRLLADVFPDLRTGGVEGEEAWRLLAEVLANHDDESLIFVGPHGRFWNLMRVRAYHPVFDVDREQVTLVPVTVAVLGHALLTVWHDAPTSQTPHAGVIDARARNGRYSCERDDDIISIASGYVTALAESYAEAVLAATRHLDRWEASFVETVTADSAPRALPTIAPVSRLRRAATRLQFGLDHLTTVRGRPLSSEAWSGFDLDPVLRDEGKRAVDQASVAIDRLRVDVSDAFMMVNTAAISAQVQAARREQGQVEHLQRLVTRLTAFLLVPSLVAAIFGANVELPGETLDARATIMWCTIGVSAILTYGILTWLERRQK